MCTWRSSSSMLRQQNSDTVPRPIHAHTTLPSLTFSLPGSSLCSARSASSAQDVYYQYPDMGVCLHVGFGCDDFFLTEACAQSSNTTEGGSRNGTFIFGWESEQQQVSSTVEKSVDGVSLKRWKLGRRRLGCGPHRIGCARDRSTIPPHCLCFRFPRRDWPPDGHETCIYKTFHDP